MLVFHASIQSSTRYFVYYGVYANMRYLVRCTCTSELIYTYMQRPERIQQIDANDCSKTKTQAVRALIPPVFWCARCVPAPEFVLVVYILVHTSTDGKRPFTRTWDTRKRVPDTSTRTRTSSASYKKVTRLKWQALHTKIRYNTSNRQGRVRSALASHTRKSGPACGLVSCDTALAVCSVGSDWSVSCRLLLPIMCCCSCRVS